MEKLLNWKTLLVGIILLGALLRVCGVGSMPPGTHADEADTGYSAYSILKTGKTQYGTFNLFALEEFNGGTHPPLYTYFLIPLVYLFDLNIVIERIPSVIFGIFTIPVFYYLALNLFKNRAIALISALLLAINPWAIHISRQGLLEAIAVFFFLSGITALLYTKKNIWLYIISGICFGLSLHSYDAPKVIVPIVIIILFFYRFKDPLFNKKYFLALCVVSAVFFLATLYALISRGQINDYAGTGIFSEERIAGLVDRERFLTNAPLWASSIFHNKITVMLSEFITSYSKIFSINWFFINGDGNMQQAIGRHGQYFIFELPLFFIGIYKMFEKKLRKKAILALLLMLLGVIPAAITLTGNFPYRAVLLLPFPILFSSYGLYLLWNYLKKKKYYNMAAKVFIISTMIVFTLSFLFIYFFDYPVYASNRWSKQQNEAIRFAHSESKNYSKIYIEGGLDWSVMYAFMYKIDPNIFQREYAKKLEDEEYNMELNNIEFVNFSKDQFEKGVLLDKNSLVVVPGEYETEDEPIRIFYDEDLLTKRFKVYLIN